MVDVSSFHVCMEADCSHCVAAVRTSILIFLDLAYQIPREPCGVPVLLDRPAELTLTHTLPVSCSSPHTWLMSQSTSLRSSQCTSLPRCGCSVPASRASCAPRGHTPAPPAPNKSMQPTRATGGAEQHSGLSTPRALQDQSSIPILSSLRSSGATSATALLAGAASTFSH